MPMGRDHNQTWRDLDGLPWVTAAQAGDWERAVKDRGAWLWTGQAMSASCAVVSSSCAVTSGFQGGVEQGTRQGSLPGSVATWAQGQAEGDPGIPDRCPYSLARAPSDAGDSEASPASFHFWSSSSSSVLSHSFCSNSDNPSSSLSLSTSS
ncbi:UNVERIFIED_CONTAM: hypothetical protein FKN15_061968 [Acipenser sinensis]